MNPDLLKNLTTSIEVITNGQQSQDERIASLEQQLEAYGSAINDLMQSQESLNQSFEHLVPSLNSLSSKLEQSVSDISGGSNASKKRDERTKPASNTQAAQAAQAEPTGSLASQSQAQAPVPHQSLDDALAGSACHGCRHAFVAFSKNKDKEVRVFRCLKTSINTIATACNSFEPSES